eukprot:GHUV01028172.1.p1 GENE.GHUV01028172.1~~GHUV01028172.1.p1  ORF type:complete len:108 (+),score=8.18 GHUV01028172.1:823-1146(+)
MACYITGQRVKNDPGAIERTAAAWTHACPYECCSTNASSHFCTMQPVHAAATVRNNPLPPSWQLTSLFAPTMKPQCWQPINICQKVVTCMAHCNCLHASCSLTDCRS